MGVIQISSRNENDLRKFFFFQRTFKYLNVRMIAKQGIYIFCLVHKFSFPFEEIFIFSNEQKSIRSRYFFLKK